MTYYATAMSYPRHTATLPVIAYKTASTCLSSGILSRVATCLSVSAFEAFSAHDWRRLFRLEQLQQQLSTVSEAASFSPAHRLCVLAIL